METLTAFLASRTLLLVWDGGQLLADEVGDLSVALGSPGTRRTITAAA